MKIILKEDHGILGSAGDVVTVKGGYARNYLIPRGIGKVANDSNIKSMHEVRRQQSKKINKDVEDAKKLAAELGQVTLNLTVKTGEDNKVFGSITSQNITDALHEKGFTGIDKRKILLPHPIREIGETTVKIKVYGEVMADITVSVEKEGGEVVIIDKVQEEIEAKKAAEAKALGITEETAEVVSEEVTEEQAEEAPSEEIVEEKAQESSIEETPESTEEQSEEVKEENTEEENKE
jgi:large subunit ribosomal protein L9